MRDLLHFACQMRVACLLQQYSLRICAHPRGAFLLYRTNFPIKQKNRYKVPVKIVSKKHSFCSTPSSNLMTVVCLLNIRPGKKSSGAFVPSAYFPFSCILLSLTTSYIILIKYAPLPNLYEIQNTLPRKS